MSTAIAIGTWVLLAIFFWGHYPAAWLVRRYNERKAR